VLQFDKREQRVENLGFKESLYNTGDKR